MPTLEKRTRISESTTYDRRAWFPDFWHQGLAEAKWLEKLREPALQNSDSPCHAIRHSLRHWHSGGKENGSRADVLSQRTGGFPQSLPVPSEVWSWPCSNCDQNQRRCAPARALGESPHESPILPDAPKGGSTTGKAALAV